MKQSMCLGEGEKGASGKWCEPFLNDSKSASLWDLAQRVLWELHRPRVSFQHLLTSGLCYWTNHAALSRPS